MTHPEVSIEIRHLKNYNKDIEIHRLKLQATQHLMNNLKNKDFPQNRLKRNSSLKYASFFVEIQVTDCPPNKQTTYYTHITTFCVKPDLTDILNHSMIIQNIDV